MNTPVLETQRLLLRPFREGDGKEVFECCENDPEVAKYMFWRSRSDVRESIAWVKMEVGRIEQDDRYRFAFVEKTSGNLIGTGLVYYENEISSWETAYNLGQKYWGKGYATEGVKRILEFAKNELGIKEIAGRHAKENIASENILKKRISICQGYSIRM